MGSPRTWKVRMIYYDPNSGLFLIQTPKSIINNYWTTPGGHVLKSESIAEGINRLSLEDLGFIPERIERLPFFKNPYISKGKRFLSFGYEVIFNTRDILRLPKEKYDFVQLEDLSLKRLTRENWDLVTSNEFQNFVDMKRKLVMV